MRRMSFSKTTAQIRNKSKWVTRRLGWSFLKPGDEFLAVEKAMGLKKGQKQVVLAKLRCIENHSEQLSMIDKAECDK